MSAEPGGGRLDPTAAPTLAAGQAAVAGAALAEPGPAPGGSAVPGPDRGPVRPGGHHETAGHGASARALTLGALGVVFGDIGTSPLYAMKETFSGAHDLAPSHSAVYGVLSLVFWSITIIVTLKYVTFIMRADNGGEGGIMALIALVRGLPLRTPMAKLGLIALGAFGAALFYGDGMITPAISVLSAVEGLELVTPGLEDFVVPITLVILTSLFAIQRFGTEVVGRLFGPVMGLWFGTLAVFGLIEVVKAPGILRALSPHYGVAFFVDRPETAFLALGSIVLAVTGAEALYADMGHFGRSPIRRAWFLFVLPALILNYLGQGALLLADPGARESPFFRLVPDGLLVPAVLLATLATVIASQAVISGAFSVTRQAVQLGFLPLLTTKQTSKKAVGQIYVPVVNWGLFVAIVALVIGFGSSTALASAYGIAVTGTLAIDTVLFFVVVRMLWHKPRWMVFGGALGFLVVDLTFFAANTTKIVSGGWFPLLIAAAVFTFLMTWRRGQEELVATRTEEEGDLLEFVLELAARETPVQRVPGTAVFLNPKSTTVPLALRYNVEFNHILHEHIIVLVVETVDVPYVDESSRCHIDTVEVPDDGIAQVVARFGFQDEVDVPAVLRLANAQDPTLQLDVDAASYFLSRSHVVASKRGGMAMWRKRLFTLTNRNAAGRAQYFRLPEDRVVSLGSTFEV